MVRTGVPRQPGPGDRQLGGERRRAGGLQVADQLRQEVTGPLQLEAQGAAQPQVVLDVTGQCAHRDPPSGQGWASRRSRSRSTRA